MDVREIAREQRRRQVLDALEFERNREAALRVSLEHTAADLEGASIDEAVFAQMTGEEVEIVRSALVGTDFELEEELDEEWLSFGPSEDELRADRTEEIARLEAELEACRRRQAAFERYLDLL